MYDEELDLLQRAAESTDGISIRSEDVEHLRRRLTEARVQARKRGLTIFDQLSFRVHPPYIELFILKPEVPANGEARLAEDDALALKEGRPEAERVLRPEGEPE